MISTSRGRRHTRPAPGSADLVMILQPLPASRRAEIGNSRLVASLALHGAALFLLMNFWWLGAERLKPAGSSTGTHLMLAYHPGKPVPPAPALHTKVTRRFPKIAPPPRIEESTTRTPEHAGNDAQGSGTVSIAYVEAFPKQRPDLSNASTTGDIVLDVEIDATGHVAQVHTRRGMGAGVDEMVIGTVERWIFYPAMLNGHAVTSERELHFHFDSRRSVRCGWECFALEG